MKNVIQIELIMTQIGLMIDFKINDQVSKLSSSA